MMNSNMKNVSAIGEHIGFFLDSAALYDILARLAPSEGEKRQLGAFADECRATAEKLGRVYRQRTGRFFDPSPSQIRESGSFRAVLRSRLKEEVAASRKLRDAYLGSGDNFRLKQALFTAFNDALCRAASLSAMLTA